MSPHDHTHSLLAACSMFTRIPAWRLCKLEQKDYEHAIDWWSVIGLITGGLMALVFISVSYLLPTPVALILAILARLLLTSGFHEDGLGDFADGFGGGTSRERILSIMKDSHVGSYAVIAYVTYYLLVFSTCISFEAKYIPVILLVSDVVAKFISGLQVQLLPYARSVEQSKTRVVYKRSRLLPLVLSSSLAIALPALLLPAHWLMGLMPPLLLSLALMAYIRHKIGGYTGDTCGAIFLITEVAIYVSLLGCLRLFG